MQGWCSTLNYSSGQLIPLKIVLSCAISSVMFSCRRRFSTLPITLVQVEDRTTTKPNGHLTLFPDRFYLDGLSLQQHSHRCEVYLRNLPFKCHKFHLYGTGVMSSLCLQMSTHFQIADWKARHVFWQFPLAVNGYVSYLWTIWRHSKWPTRSRDGSRHVES